jgi:hypothetical protein
LAAARGPPPGGRSNRTPNKGVLLTTNATYFWPAPRHDKGSLSPGSGPCPRRSHRCHMRLPSQRRLRQQCHATFSNSTCVVSVTGKLRRLRASNTAVQRAQVRTSCSLERVLQLHMPCLIDFTVSTGRIHDSDRRRSCCAAPASASTSLPDGGRTDKHGPPPCSPAR